MQEKELPRKLGEETIYSAKGHFKACDLRRQFVTFTIWGCTLLNVVGIIGVHPLADKILSAVGLFGDRAGVRQALDYIQKYKGDYWNQPNELKQLD